ncbi:MAG: hypothetical protein JWO32_1843 [Bacteroidetes bacterium]|nr:hypothetical protein [Bacteroidota bacterium]
MKKLILLATTLVLSLNTRSQILYSNSFGNLSLQNYTTVAGVTQYTTVPGGLNLINDGLNNNIGSLSNPNSPFNVPSLQSIGWAVVANSIENDTFLVSTSWLDTTLVADRWVITPSITNITGNTVLTWLAKSPDPNYADGYEVYATNKTGALVAGDFTIGDRLFAIADGHIAGGGEKSIWTRHSVNLGSFAGQALRFAFRNNSTNMYQLWIDDIEVKTLPLSLDGALTSVETEKYILTNASHSVTVTFSNAAAAAINTITLNYQYGNSTPVSQVFNFIYGLQYGQSSKITFALPYSVSSPGYYPIKAWASLPNNVTDQNITNDTMYTSVTAMTSSPQKKVLVEQFLSAKDPESPDAQEKLQAIQSSSVIVVNIHDNDSLKETNSTGILSYRKQYSTAMIDRTFYDSLATAAITRSYYAKKINLELAKATPVTVSILNKTYNSVTRQLSFTVKGDFSGEVKGDYRLNAYLVENNISGNASDTTVNGFNQLSNFYNVPWSPYYQRGYFSFAENSYVLNAWQYKQQRVLINAPDGSFGSPGIIPQTGGTQGQSYQTSYTITLPLPANGVNKYNPDNIYIVGFVSEFNADPNKRSVLNVAQDKLNGNPEVVGINEHATLHSLSFYPNPTNGVVYFAVPASVKNCLLEVRDLMGRCVYKNIIVNPEFKERLDLSYLPSGTYLISLQSSTMTSRNKIIIQK